MNKGFRTGTDIRRQCLDESRAGRRDEFTADVRSIIGNACQQLRRSRSRHRHNAVSTAHEAAADVDVFLKLLAKHFPDIPVIKEDERFTSVLALRAMIDGGMKKSDRREKGAADKISAALILQTYLDRKKNGLI